MRKTPLVLMLLSMPAWAQSTPEALRAQAERPDAGRRAELRVKHLTGFGDRVVLAADPAIMPSPDGRGILVGGTGTFLRWPSIEALLANSKPEPVQFRYFQKLAAPSGSPGMVVELAPNEDLWDKEIYRIGNEFFLYAGALTPGPGRVHADRPLDDATRRVKVARFDLRLGGWVFEAESPLNPIDFRNAFQGHCYGHQLAGATGRVFPQIFAANEPLVIFNEEITSTAGALTTEIFGRRMRDPFHSDPSTKTKLIAIPDLPADLTRRQGSNDRLVEGPRYLRTRVGNLMANILFFSSRDFALKSYTTLAAYSLEGPGEQGGMLGPYRLVEDARGRAVNLTETLQNTYGLHGVGRAFPFEAAGSRWILFHGAPDQPGFDHVRVPEAVDSFDRERSLWVAPIAILPAGRDARGTRLQIVITAPAGR